MSDCCSPKGYRSIFSEKRAQAEAQRYRRRGLDRTSRRIVELLKQQGIMGRTLLEVGGGIGAIQIELLRAGITRAVNIELTPTYEEAAQGLLREARLEDRLERRVMDFAEATGELQTADIVIMNRVICCYPDMPKLAGAAADHTREVLVVSFPKERLVDSGGDKRCGPRVARSAPAVPGLPSPARQDLRHGGAARAEDGRQPDELLLGSRQSSQNHRDAGKLA